MLAQLNPAPAKPPNQGLFGAANLSAEKKEEGQKVSDFDGLSLGDLQPDLPPMDAAPPMKKTLSTFGQPKKEGAPAASNPAPFAKFEAAPLKPIPENKEEAKERAEIKASLFSASK